MKKIAFSPFQVKPVVKKSTVLSNMKSELRFIYSLSDPTAPRVNEKEKNSRFVQKVSITPNKFLIRP